MPVPHLPPDFIPDPRKPMTDGQRAYLLYLRGNLRQMRVESVARAVLGKDFEDCSEVDAHELIQYWLKYDPGKGLISYEAVAHDLGRARRWASVAARTMAASASAGPDEQQNRVAA